MARIMTAADRFVLISGCSGGGKSTLLAELGARGFATVEEPGRRIVKEERASGGSALPWIDAEAFARRALVLARADWEAAADADGWVFFDRGLIDAAVALQHLTGEPAAAWLGPRRSYGRIVILAPPWPEIHMTDAERRHGLDEAIAEYERLTDVLPGLGHEAAVLPRIGVAERADWVLETLAG